MERALDRIASIGRDNPRFRLALGDWKMKRGEPEGALPQFERALELSPGQPEALRGLALAQLELGEPELALERFDQLEADLAAIDFAHPDSHLLAILEGRRHDALAILENAAQAGAVLAEEINAIEDETLKQQMLRLVRAIAKGKSA